MSKPLRPATAKDVPLVHAQLKAALVETFPHLPQFQHDQERRFSPDYLQALIKANPSYVFILEIAGKQAGFIISGPEQGVIVHYWAYIDPANRKGGLASASLKQFVEHWENGCFHKASAYTTPKNRVAQLLLKKNGFSLTASLEKQIFGQDFLLFEHPLNKVAAGYEEVPALRLGQIIKQRFLARLRKT